MSTIKILFNPIGNTSSHETCIKMHRILRLVVSVSIFFIFSNVAFATDYYVATDGTNIRDGLSIENAWATPSYAATKVVEGDTIYLINGTWENEVINLLGKHGTDTNPITLTKYNGTVILNNSYIEAVGTVTKTSYINISNITISNSPRIGIQFRNADNIHIRNVEVFNTSDIGISYYDTINSSITDSSVHNTGWNSVMVTSNNRDVYNILIENNTIHDSFFNGTEHNLVDFFNYANSYQYNITVKGNKIYNTLHALLYFHNGATNKTFSYFNISNNIMYNTTINGYVYSNYLKDSIFKDNIITYTSIKIDKNAAYGNVTYINNTIRPLTSNTAYSLYLPGNQNTTQTSKNENVTSYRTLGGEFIIQDSTVTTYTVRGTGLGITVKYSDNTLFSETGIDEPKYYPTHSNWTTNDDTTRSITTYPMTARPASSSATVTVASFNTSLPSGSILADFTANTTNGNNVNFTMSTLKPYYYYLIKKDGVNLSIQQADATGKIAFNNSVWNFPSKFMVMENAPGSPDGNMTFTIGDLVIVKEHFGEKTWPPYPKYDPNKDGIVDIMDIVYVATKIMT